MEKFLTSLALLFVVMLTVTSVVSANGQVKVSLSAHDSAAMKSVVGNGIEVELKATAPSDVGKTMISHNGNDFVFNSTVYANATDKSKKAAMKQFVNGLQNSAVTEQTQQYIIDSMSESDSNVSRMLIPLVMDKTSADIYTAIKWMTPFLPIVRVLFGIAAITIVILLVGSTILDLCYIGLPFLRDGGGKDGNSSKVPFVTFDAMSVIKETEASIDSSGGYKNAYLIYFKRRVLTYVLLSICVLYLVVGELGGLIAWLLGLGDGIVGG